MFAATATAVLAVALVAFMAFWLFDLDRRLSAAEDIADGLDRDLYAVEALVDRLLEERTSMAEADHHAA